MSATASSRRAVHLLSAVALATTCLMAQASTSGVVISQVYGGGGNSGATYTHDFIELFNAGAAPVSLNGWSVQYASAAGTSWQKTALGNVTLQPGQYYLVQEAQGTGGTTPLPTPDVLTGGTNPNAALALSGTAGKVALVSNNTALTSAATPTSAGVVDYVGFGTTASAFEGSGATPAPSNTAAVIRLNAGCTDTDSNNTDFAASAPTPRNTASTLNVCTANGGGGGNTGGGANGSTVKIYDIQGTGSASPMVNANITTTGVVTKVINNGFYLQDPVGDSNPLTSDGILVFTSTAPTVVAGQLVQVSGKVAEFNVGAAGNAQTLAHTVTEITAPTVTVQGSGYSITPTPITLPVASDDELERLEGMLVTINSQLTASQNYFLGRYGQVTLSANGRLEVPTNRVRPGAGAQALADQNALSSILLDDGTSVQNPNPTPYFAADNTLRAGDTVDSVTGVIDYGLATASNTGIADYKIHPTQSLTFTRVNARTAAPDAVGGNVKVASANVLNFFTTFTDGNTAAGLSGQGCTLGGAIAASNCRGADNLAEFNRQRAKIVEAIAGTNGDVVGLMEIQNNVPSGSGTNADTAVLNLVAALNAKLGANTYAAVTAPTGSTGTDAIRVAMIYKPAKLSLSGAALSDTNAINNRPPLAQTFAALNGEKFSVVVNHLKSKGSCPSSAADADADQGDLQGCWNDLRVQQAARLRSFVTTVQTASGNIDVILIGDFNAYAQEDPIDELTSHGYVDQIGRFNNFGYSYVFDGAAGRLDHAITTPSLSTKITRAIEWHINADEPSVIDYNTEFKQPACAACGPDYYSATPYRGSDHDPVIVGLNLLKSVNGTPGRDTLTGTAGDDVINGGEGSDTITTGAGQDVLVYTSVRDGLDTITDFTPGTDRIDLSALLASLGIAPSQAIPGGYVRLVDSSAGVQVQLDTDGSAGTAVPRALIVLRGVTASQLQTARDLGL